MGTLTAISGDLKIIFKTTGMDNTVDLDQPISLPSFFDSLADIGPEQGLKLIVIFNSVSVNVNDEAVPFLSLIKMNGYGNRFNALISKLSQPNTELRKTYERLTNGILIVCINNKKFHLLNNTSNSEVVTLATNNTELNSQILDRVLPTIELDRNYWKNIDIFFAWLHEPINDNETVFEFAIKHASNENLEIFFKQISDCMFGNNKECRLITSVSIASILTQRTSSASDEIKKAFANMSGSLFKRNSLPSLTPLLMKFLCDNWSLLKDEPLFYISTILRRIIEHKKTHSKYYDSSFGESEYQETLDSYKEIFIGILDEHMESIVNNRNIQKASGFLKLLDELSSSSLDDILSKKKVEEMRERLLSLFKDKSKSTISVAINNQRFVFMVDNTILAQEFKCDSVSALENICQAITDSKIYFEIQQNRKSLIGFLQQNMPAWFGRQNISVLQHIGRIDSLSDVIILDMVKKIKQCLLCSHTDPEAIAELMNILLLRCPNPFTTYYSNRFLGRISRCTGMEAKQETLEIFQLMSEFAVFRDSKHVKLNTLTLYQVLNLITKDFVGIPFMDIFKGSMTTSERTKAVSFFIRLFKRCQSIGEYERYIYLFIENIDFIANDKVDFVIRILNKINQPGADPKIQKKISDTFDAYKTKTRFCDLLNEICDSVMAVGDAAQRVAILKILHKAENTTPGKISTLAYILGFDTIMQLKKILKSEDNLAQDMQSMPLEDLTPPPPSQRKGSSLVGSPLL